VVQFLSRFAVIAVLVAALVASAAAAPPVGSALPTTTVICDGVSTGTVQLTTVSIAEMKPYATRAKIKGSAAEYILIPHQGTADGVNLVDASDGRQWQKVQSGGGPSAHATTHEAGGSDAIPLDTLAAPTDITTLNASTSAHGLAPKRSGSATDCLLGNGTYAACLSGISIGAGTILGNNGGTAGAPFALTGANVKALIQVGAADIVDSPAFGQSLVKAGSASAVLTLLGTGSAALQPSSAFDAAGAAAAVQAASQPVDSDLTAVAALTTTTFGRGLLTQADASTTRSTLGLGSAATQASSAFDASGAAVAAQSASQPLAALLTAFAAQSPLSDRLTYWTGSGTLALTTYTSAARTFDAAADATAETALLNVVDATHKGLAPAGGGSTSTFLNANGAYATPALSLLSGSLNLNQIATIAASTFLGNNGGTSATPLAMTVPQAKTLLTYVFSDLGGSAACAQLPALTGDVTTSAGSCATAVGANRITLSMQAAMTAASVMGNATGSSATPTAIASAADGDVLRRSGTTIGWGQLGSGNITDGTIANADLTVMANGSIKCRTTAGTGAPEDCTGAQALAITGAVAKAGDSLTGPLATSKDFRYGTSAGQPSASLGGASPVMVDWTSGAVQEKVLSSNVTGTPTFTAPATTPAYGFVNLAFRLKQAVSGGPFTVAAWPASAKWPNGQTPVMPTTAGAYLWISCKYDQTTYDCMSSGNGGGFQ
jgi:hypothetical protein